MPPRHDRIRLEDAYPILSQETDIIDAMTDTFGKAEADALLHRMKEGDPMGERADEVHNLVLQVLLETGVAEDTLFGEGSGGEFPVRIMGYGPLYWIDPEGQDRIGYFLSLDSAVDHAEAEFETGVYEEEEYDIDEEDFDQDDEEEGSYSDEP